MDAKSLLDGLMGHITSAAGSATAKGGLTDKAKSAWDNQSPLGKGAIAGGLLGLLLTGNAKKLMTTGVKVGGAALIGGLAYKAYEDWKSGKAAAPSTEGPVALPEPTNTRFLPAEPAAANDLALHLVQAMVSAAKADGHVTAEESSKIRSQLAQLGLGIEAEQMISQELEAPLDAGRIAALARTEEEAAELYAASLLVIDPDGPAEKGYLALLAARLNLPAGLVDHLHAKVAQLS